MKALLVSTKFASTLVLLAFLAACSDSNSSEEAGAPPAMPPTTVSVIEATPEQLSITNQLPGRIAPTRIAQVRPRVSGIIVERVFVQGGMVKQGDVLYRIDPAPFQLQVDSAQASLQRTLAIQLQARQQSDRSTQLRDRKIGTVQDFETASGALAAADADVALARVAVAEAELNLRYTNVTAPIDGRIGSALITEGALVTVGGAENLAIIQQLDPVYADFTQPSTELLRLRRALTSGAIASPAPGQASVKLLMDDDTEYPHPGRLLFSDASVDATTGQVTLRAEIPNPDDNLLPGSYVRVLIEQGIESGAFAVPQQAVQRDSGGNSQLYVVNAENIVELRNVKVGRAIGSRSVIEDGLTGGERIVVEGVQKIRPGAPVTPEEWKSPATITAAAAQTPAS